jgi:hypothetical protein
MMERRNAVHPSGTLVARFVALNWPLALAVLAMLASLVVALVGLVVNPRVITGAPAWLKPVKFLISGSIYCATFIWLLSLVRGRLASIVAWVTAVGLLIEIALISFQAARGTTSHFNVSTPLNSAIWSVMGATIVCIWTAGLVTAILLMRRRLLPDPALSWAVRLGVLISLIGMGVAFLMTSPTAAQLSAQKAGHGLPIAGAHSVGVADGGPGLPILGWSTVGGDLRAPHFVGLHALQLLPLAAWLLGRYGTRLSTTSRVASVWLVGVVYLGLVGILTWQALRAQSIIHPDARTLAAFGALIAVGIAGTAIILLHERRGAATHPARIEAQPIALAGD